METLGLIHKDGEANELGMAWKTSAVTSRRLPHPLALFFAAAFCLVGVAALVLYFVPGLQAEARNVALWSSFVPYGAVMWVVATLILFLAGHGRGRLLALVPVAGLIASFLVFVPYFDASHRAPAGTTPTLRIMTLNMHYGQADQDQLFAEVSRVKPDLVVLTEFTETASPLLTEPRWKMLLPYHVGTTGDALHGPWGGDATGTQVLSRTPLAELAQTKGTGATNLAVSVNVDGTKMVLIAAHPMNPIRGKLDGWLSDNQALVDMIGRYHDQPMVVAGDLNAVPEHYTYRALMDGNGLHPVVDGWKPTFPADKLVPLITIDHVLASPQFQTVSLNRFWVADTDHLGSVAQLAFRPAG